MPEQKVSESQPGQKVRAHLQNNQSIKAGDLAQVVESLPHKCEALSSKPSTAKNKNSAPLRRRWYTGSKTYFDLGTLFS
jgi:hypothetical protein